MNDVLDRLANRGAPTGTVVLAADPDDAPKVQEAQAALKRAERLLEAAKPEEVAAADERVEEARTALAALLDDLVTVTFSLEGAGATVVEALMVEHQPTKQQVQKALKDSGGRPDARPAWNEDTFPQALLALTVASITYSDDEAVAEGPFTVSQIDGIWQSKLTVADRSSLFLTALSLDQRGSTLGDLGKG